ncbi:MAG: two-component system response regulator [Nocardioides sp.]|nr:two-component system response regulator [Nocardioides sp.]
MSPTAGRYVGRSVLVVDDDEMVVALVRVGLEAHGIEVVTATDGYQAMARLAEAVPDVIVSDINMPGMDGFALVSRLRADPATRTVPLLFLTSRAESGDVLNGLALGADDYIRKPFALDEVVARVVTKLDRPPVPVDWVERELAMQDELDRAAEVQAHLLPQAPPPMQGLQVAGACQPARSIGGDFFDWFVLPDGRVQLVIADVMGKGLGTGIVAANVRAVLRAALRFNEPADAVTRAAVVLEDDLQRTGVFVTAFIARIDQRDWSVDYVDAGHGLALVLAPDGAMRRLQTGGLPLGALAGERWTSRRTILHPGETLMTASDGFLDPFAGGAAIMAFATSANQAANTAQDLVDAWARVASEFDAQDDMTFLAARRPA